MPPPETLACLDYSLQSLPANLALDEALLQQAEATGAGELLRFWDWPEHAVVLGASGEVSRDVDQDQCERDRVAIERRSSGGGTVLLGPGCLLFSLILSVERHPALRQVNSSYRFILERLQQALAPLGSVEHAGICDLTLEGRKFSGNAQQRKQRFILHHGTLLYDFDLARIPRYLHQPERQPDYRANRPHGEFVRNLPATRGQLREWLRDAWGADPAVGVELPLTELEGLVASKYSRREWVYRR